jgi:hypothetical protein
MDLLGPGSEKVPLPTELGIGEEVIQTVEEIGVLPVFDPETGDTTYGIRDESGVHPFDSDQLRALDAYERATHLRSNSGSTSGETSIPRRRELFETADLERRYGMKSVGTSAIRGATQSSRQLGGQQ